MKWLRERGGWVGHPAIAGETATWFGHPLPGWWWRLTHRCVRWSIGIAGWLAEQEVIERCLCGAHRIGHTIDMVHSWPGPSDLIFPLGPDYVIDTPWLGRNSRYQHGAIFYQSPQGG